MLTFHQRYEPSNRMKNGTREHRGIKMAPGEVRDRGPRSCLCHAFCDLICTYLGASGSRLMLRKTWEWAGWSRRPTRKHVPTHSRSFMLINHTNIKTDLMQKACVTDTHTHHIHT